MLTTAVLDQVGTLYYLLGCNLVLKMALDRPIQLNWTVKLMYPPSTQSLGLLEKLQGKNQEVCWITQTKHLINGVFRELWKMSVLLHQAERL